METPDLTKMVKSDVAVHKTKMTKVKCLRPFMHEGNVVTENQIVEVPEEMAQELTTKIYEGPMAFNGERHMIDGEVRNFQVKRAVRV